MSHREVRDIPNEYGDLERFVTVGCDGPDCQERINTRSDGYGSWIILLAENDKPDQHFHARLCLLRWAAIETVRMAKGVLDAES